MARIYAHKKGKSGSKKPYRISLPGWVRHKPKEIESLILKFNKDGMSNAAIGLKLRDVYGVPSVKLLCERSLSQILKDNNVKREVPEDLFHLMKRAVTIHKYLDTNKKDLNARHGMQNIEMKIWRLLKYYRRTKVLPQDWKYTRESAALIVSGG